jgi:hypothetical protein
MRQASLDLTALLSHHMVLAGSGLTENLDGLFGEMRPDSPASRSVPCHPHDKSAEEDGPQRSCPCAGDG